MDLQTALTFRHSTVQQDIVCAVDAISDLCQTLDRLEVATAMPNCGPTILLSADVVQRVQQALGDRCVGLFAGVLPHAPVEMLQEAVEVAAHLRPEALVSVGGGSSHDTAKGVATLLGQGGRIHDHETRFEPPDTVVLPSFSRQRIPIVTVPTTMGAAELSRGAGFTDKILGRKIVVG